VNRRELIQRLVLNAICDDYENVDQVPSLSRAAWPRRISYPVPGKLTESMPSLEVVEANFQTYFYITKQGMVLHRSDDKWWPFDDESKLLE
jgi:hypothetical protein